MPVREGGADMGGVGHAIGPVMPGDVLLMMAKSEFSAQRTRRFAKQLMRAVLQRQLGPKPLNIRSMVSECNGSC